MPVFYLFIYCLLAWKALLFCPCFHSHTRVWSTVLKLCFGGVCLRRPKEHEGSQRQETAVSWRSSGPRGDGVSEPDHLCLAVNLLFNMSLCWKCHRNKDTGVTHGSLSWTGLLLGILPLTSSYFILTELCLTFLNYAVYYYYYRPLAKVDLSCFCSSVFFYQTDFNETFRECAIDAHRQRMNFWTNNTNGCHSKLTFKNTQTSLTQSVVQKLG